jgi:hypothetical protein
MLDQEEPVKTLIAMLTVCAISPAFAQEHAPPMHSAPAQIAAKIIAENELVQVVRTSIPGHASTPLHDVTPRVVIWLRDAHFVDRFADGGAMEERRKSGDAEWVPMRRHSGQNLSDAPMEFVAVIVKAAAVSGTPGQGASPHQ